MKKKFRLGAVAAYSVIGTVVVLVLAHFTGLSDRLEERRETVGGRRSFGPSRDSRGGRGPGGGGGVRSDFPLRQRFDKNGDQILDIAERAAAREFLQKERAEGRGPRRGPMANGRQEVSSEPGKKISPSDVQAFSKEPLYDPEVLRTFFLEFDSEDWEKELDEFYRTDVELPARLIVDGKSYPDVGVHFHGASSYFTLREFGSKASMVLKMDMARDKQNLLGYRSIDLLNSHTDPSFLRTVLYLHIAREYIPAPKANFARLVINGENWGVYINSQHFNKDFIEEWHPKAKGARWKVPGSPRAQGGLSYLGEDVAPYKRIYEIKSKDDPTSWQQLIRLCRVLSETASNKLEAELNKVLDVNGALKFLALENALINSDGYWIRSSDYSLYSDEVGRFHLVPHDANETFAPPQGPGFGQRGGGEPGVALDPTAGSDDSSKPLLHRLLAVPELRAGYFGYVRQIAEQSMDWAKLGPVAARYHKLIDDDVKVDRKKLYPYEVFEGSLGDEDEGDGNRRPGSRFTLKDFVEKRRAFLLEHPEVKKASISSLAK